LPNYLFPPASLQGERGILDFCELKGLSFEVLNSSLFKDIKYLFIIIDVVLPKPPINAGLR
jgi:hypothetical protein